MLGASKYGNRAAIEVHRASSACRDSCSRNRPIDTAARLLRFTAIAAWCWTGYAAAQDAPAAATMPVKIAVFPFELEDFSAAGKQAPGPAEAAALAQATEEARQQLHQSGRYVLADTAGADLGATEGQGFRNCGGCEAAIAMKLGADQALIGVVTKISMTEYVVRLQISDAQKDAVISGFTTDLRMGTTDSWFRGVRSLMKNRVLASQ